MGWFSDLFSGGSSGGSSTDWLGLVGEGLNLFGQYTEGQGRKSAYENKANALRDNAAYELERAADSNVRGSAELEKYGVSAQRYMGKQIAEQGASGITVGSGSFQDVNRSTEAVTQQDMQTIMRNTMREAYGHTLAAQSGVTAAGDYDRAASNSWLNSQLGIMGSIITGDLADGLVKKYWE